MLSRTKLFDLVAASFDESAMLNALEEKVSKLIDYDELASSIVDEHEDILSEIIAEMTEEAI